MDPRWYVARGARQLGPYTLEELQEFAASRRIEPADLLLQVGSQNWVTADSVPELFPSAAVVNTLPFASPAAHTRVLSAIHLPIALWFAVGFAYVGGRWRGNERRMDFVRFTGD